MIGLRHIKGRGLERRVTLFKALSRGDITICFTINDNRVGNRCDALHNERNSFPIKSKPFHNSPYKTPFNPVKGITHIEFDRHETILPLSFVVQAVH